MSGIKNIINGSLKSKLIELIRAKQPLSVYEYMKIVLTNPESGFYMNNDVFGVKGHFTTNPEISQVFGEILGVWILQEWQRFKCPKPLNLVEFGPGRGTLMADITRVISNFKQTQNNLQIRMIEMSPHLREVQKETLKLNTNLSDRIQWYSHIESLDDDQNGFTAYIAHEFLDALPIHKFVKDPVSKQWRELLIDYDQNNNLRFCISKNPSLASRLLIPQNFQGDHIEVCSEAALLLEKVSKRLNKYGKGCMLVCDYGFEDEPDATFMGRPDEVASLKPVRSNRDTFRAFKNHEPWYPLKDPGQADLTADVDFGYLKRHLKDKAVLFGPVDQKSFLVKCGLHARLNVLLDNANHEEKKDLISGANMMLNDMGERYKFLAFFPKDTESLFEADPPAGFITS